MIKTLKITGMVGIALIGAFAVAVACYGLYQQSQLYPRLHQEIGFSVCAQQVQAQQNQVTTIDDEQSE
jgi:hypothetical protein